MPREAKKVKQARAIEACTRIHERYGDAEPALAHENVYQLLIAVMLSAQTTDAAVNQVTPELFRRWPSPFELAEASVADVAETIHRLGFFRSKAAHAVECAQILVAEHDGVVPRTMEELTALPGVGRKTANIVLNVGYGIVEGIAVDTHVFRIATRLKLTNAPTPAQAEADLLNVIPEELWAPVNSTWIRFGREICDARSPRCDDCPLEDICPSAHKVAGNPKPKSKTKSKTKAKSKTAAMTKSTATAKSKTKATAKTKSASNSTSKANADSKVSS